MPTLRPPVTRTLTGFEVPSDLTWVRAARDRAIACLGQLPVPAERIEPLRSAVAEAIVNAIEHGNRLRRELAVRIEVRAGAGTARVAVTDRAADRAGSGVDDLAEDGPGEPRGWGLMLMRGGSDRMRVTHRPGRRTVELIVRVEPVRRLRPP